MEGNNFITAGDFAMWDTARTSRAGNFYGDGCGYGYGHRGHGAATTGVALGASDTRTRRANRTRALTENRGQDGMVTVDRQKVFRLVPKQDSVVSDSGSCGCRCGLDVEAVELTTELHIPSLGKGVIHVYNIARSVWGNGLDSDGETVSVKVAEDSADVLSVDKDGLHINKEAIGTGGGTAVTPEEIDEIMGIINSGQENRKANEVNYPETKDFGASWADQSNL